MEVQTMTRAQIDAFVLQRIEDTLAAGRLVSLATGNTFATLFPALDGLLRGLRDRGLRPSLTHLDEYLGLPPEDPRSMVGQLRCACPVLGDLASEGRFLVVPFSGEHAALADYRERVAALGGVGLQLLGIGGNGHIAFNEPGSPADSRLRVVELADSTRRLLLSDFDGDPPRHGVTAGVADILDAGEIILVALGRGKAVPVRRMLTAPAGADCPASFLQGHARITVCLDHDAAAEGAPATP